eukprot:Clim_evm45s198 gene=Clim_evmTU45s198
MTELFVKELLTVTRVNGVEENTTRSLLVRLVQDSTALELSVQDTVDPFYQFVVRLDNEAFVKLKGEQSLLVEYSDFGNHVAELLRQCGTEHKDLMPSADSPSKTRAQFVSVNTKSSDVHEADTAVFEIIEQTAFRQLSHLTLTLRAEKEQIQRNMVRQRYLSLVETCASLRLDISNLQTQLGGEVHRRETMEKDIETLKTVHEQDRTHLQDTWSEKVTQVREAEQAKFVAAETNYRSQTARLEATHKADQDRIEKLLSEIEDLQSRCFKQQNTINERDSTVANLESMMIKKDECLAEKDAQIQTLSSTVQDQNAHAASLSQDLQKAKRDIDELNEAVTQAHEGANKCEALAAELQVHKEALDTANTNKAQADEALKELAELLNMRTQYAAAKEEALNDMAAKVHNLEQQITAGKIESGDLECKLSQALEEKAKLNKEQSTLQTRCEELEKINRTNERVINWLNKQLNGGLGSGIDGSPSSLSSSLMRSPASLMPSPSPRPTPMPSAPRTMTKPSKLDAHTPSATPLALNPQNSDEKPRVPLSSYALNPAR